MKASEISLRAAVAAAPHFHLWFFPWTERLAERYSGTSLSEIRPAMAGAMQEPRTPDQVRRVLQCVDRMREAADGAA